MAYATYDYYNHQGVAPGATFTTGATGTSVAGTIVPVAAGAGSGSSTAVPAGATPNDTRGVFNIVTAGTPAAGAVATVNFAAPYSQAPGAIVVTVLDTTASPAAPILAAVSSVTGAGFSISTGALTTAHTYQVNYQVEA